MARRGTAYDLAARYSHLHAANDTILDEVDHTAYLRLEETYDQRRMLPDAEDPSAEM